MERDFAYAEISGNSEYPEINGLISFIQYPYYVKVSLVLANIPKDRFLGFHIHEGTTCSGNSEDEFADAKTHYNPDNLDHPDHAGDLPSIYSYDGKARMTYITDKFLVKDIIGKTVILHENPDDFRSQPAGDAGDKIACGEITH